MLRVGLTGGIGCGKSTVAAALRELGVPVFDADAFVHEMLKAGQPAYAEIVREFGNDILSRDGQIDRSVLGAIVFADRACLARLNQITHPRVMEAVVQWFDSHDRPGGPRVAVVEAALLVEAGYRESLDRLIAVSCPPDQQLARLLARGLTEGQALERIDAQMPVAQKAALADYVIDTAGTIANTERQVRELVNQLNQLPGARLENDRNSRSAL
jgi:dephospho-CoA kinase